MLADRRAKYEADPETFKARVRSYQQANPEKVAETRERAKGTAKYSARNRRAHIKRTYGITADAADAMLAGQGGQCVICRNEDPGKCWCIDHDHQTGKVRGILCWHCNVALGHFRDDPRALIAAADYVIRNASIEGRI
jgi:hypothetical protein